MEFQVFTTTLKNNSFYLYGLGGQWCQSDAHQNVGYVECSSTSCHLDHYYYKPLDHYRTEKLRFHKYFGQKKEGTYECGIDPIIQFYTKKNISSWVRVEDNDMFGIDRDSILPNMLSIDIECNNNSKNGTEFPNSDRDEIITIGNVFKNSDEEIVDTTAFVLYDIDDYESKYGRIVCFDNEVDMLKAWMSYVVEKDPDVIIGHNVINFDLVFILSRCQKLGIVPNFGRQPHPFVYYFSKKKDGAMDNYIVKCNGRLILDTFRAAMDRNIETAKSLEALSQHFFGEGKDDMTAGQITQNFKTPRGRGLIADYCLKDCILPLRLEVVMQIWNQMAERAKIVRLPPSEIMSRGQQFLIVSLIYYTIRGEYLIPDRIEYGGGTKNYEGAIVLPPKRGFYTDPVAVFDFASLYPSIMIAKNLCYTTLCRSSKVLSNCFTPPFQDENADQVVNFVKPDIQEGVLPQILKTLLEQRAKTRKLMKGLTDKNRFNALNAMQLGYKATANSIYGFTGALAIGYLPCLEISSSVTAYGRYMIEQTKALLESESFNVLYGDTDSVMFIMKDGDDLFERAERYCQYINEKLFSNSAPIKLEFEKIFKPFLLCKVKKRYVGLKFTSPDDKGKMDIKGLQCVRRDSCEFIKKIFSSSLNALLIDRSLDGAFNVLTQSVSDLENQRVLEEDLQTAQKYKRRDYKNKNPLITVLELMEADNTIPNPVVGDIIRWVYGKKVKKATPLYSIARLAVQGRPAMPENVDFVYYVNQMRDNFWQLFSEMGDVRDRYTQIFRKYVAVTVRLPNEPTKNKKESNAPTKKLRAE